MPYIKYLCTEKYSPIAVLAMGAYCYAIGAGNYWGILLLPIGVAIERFAVYLQED